MQTVVMLSVVMLSVSMQTVVVLSVSIMNVVSPLPPLPSTYMPFQLFNWMIQTSFNPSFIDAFLLQSNLLRV
jgi:hypothetical protein